MVVMGCLATLAVGVVVGDGLLVVVVGGVFAAPVIIAVVVGVRLVLGLSVVGVLLLMSLRLGQALCRSLPNRSQMGRALLVAGWSLLLWCLAVGLLVVVGVVGDLVGVVTWDCQEKKLMTGEGVGGAAWACQRVVAFFGNGRGDIAGGWFVVIVEGVVGVAVGVVVVSEEVGENFL